MAKLYKSQRKTWLDRIPKSKYGAHVPLIARVCKNVEKSWRDGHAFTPNMRMD